MIAHVQSWRFKSRIRATNRVERGVIGDPQLIFSGVEENGAHMRRWWCLKSPKFGMEARTDDL
ncbi:MAG: hypothetical protein ABGZ23_26040, partial [Fuerstiella sp.]